MVKGENHARKCAQSKRYSVGPRGDPRVCITAAVVLLMPKLSPARVCQCELISVSVQCRGPGEPHHQSLAASEAFMGLVSSFSAGLVA